MEGLELLSRIIGQKSTLRRPPTQAQATEGLEAAINRGRLQLLDVEELMPVVQHVAGVEGLEWSLETFGLPEPAPELSEIIPVADDGPQP